MQIVDNTDPDQSSMQAIGAFVVHLLNQWTVVSFVSDEQRMPRSGPGC